jgi:hypothetical protein
MLGRDFEALLDTLEEANNQPPKESGMWKVLRAIGAIVFAGLLIAGAVMMPTEYGPEVKVEGK